MCLLGSENVLMLEKRKTRPFTAEEITEAEIYWIQVTQNQVSLRKFPVVKGSRCKNSKLSKIQPLLSWKIKED